jgi:O-antigen/teichoic acid export membrane protein
VSTPPAGRAERSEGRRIARNSALLAIGDGTSLALGFVSTILVTDSLGERYGPLVAAQRFVGPFLVIVQFGLYPLLVRAFASGRGDPGALFATALALRAVLGAVFAFSVPLVAHVAGYLPEQRWLLHAFVGIELLGVIAETFMARCEGFEAFGRSAVIGMSRSLATFAGVAVATWLGGGLAAFVAVYGVSRVVQLAVAAAVVRKAGPRFRLRLDFASVRPLLREAIWFMGVGLTATIQATLAVVLLARFSTAAETARFGACLNFLDVVLVLPVLLQRTLLPAFSRLSRTGGATGIAHDALRVIPTLLIPAGVGMACLAEAILALYPSGEFADAAPVLRLVALWLVFNGPAHVCAAFLTGIGRLRALILVNVLGACLQALLLMVAIPRAGAVGAAAGTLVAYGAVTALLLTLARQSGVALPWSAFLRAAAASLAMAAALVGVRQLFLPLAVAAGAAVFGGVWWLLVPKHGLERRWVLSLLAELRGRLRRR